MRFVRIAAALAALSFALPAAAQSMNWYRWDPAAATLPKPGSNAVLGVASAHDLGLLKSKYRFTVIRAFPALLAAEIRVSPALLAGAAADPRIRYVSALDSSQSSLFALNPLLNDIDPTTSLPYEWQFDAANMRPALEISPGSPSVTVGTIDSGAAEIPDLSGKVDSYWTVTPDGNLTRSAHGVDYVGHGSAVASLIAANGYGMAGFGGATHLVVVRAPELTDLAVAVALMKLDSLHVRIVNLSFGSPAPERPIVLDAIHKAQDDGMLLIAAAGNSAEPVAHPAADLQPPGGVESAGLAVGASDIDGKLAYFSNSGDNLSLLAPGVKSGTCSGVLVAAPLSDVFVNACYPEWTSSGAWYAYVSGTSFAAPEVAGVAALIWAARPSLTNVQVATILKQSAHRTGDAWTPKAGWGVLDAGAALALAVSRPAGTPASR